MTKVLTVVAILVTSVKWSTTVGGRDEAMVGLTLVICNEGSAFTFRRGVSESIIDVIWADKNTAWHMSG